MHCLKFLGIFNTKLTELSQQLCTHIFGPVLGVTPATTTSAAAQPPRTTRAKAKQQQQQQQQQNDSQRTKSVLVQTDDRQQTHELTLSTEPPVSTPVPETKVDEPQTKPTNSKRGKKGAKAAAQQAIKNSTTNTKPPVPEVEPGLFVFVFVSRL